MRVNTRNIYWWARMGRMTKRRNYRYSFLIKSIYLYLNQKQKAKMTLEMKQCEHIHTHTYVFTSLKDGKNIIINLELEKFEEKNLFFPTYFLIFNIFNCNLIYYKYIILKLIYHFFSFFAYLLTLFFFLVYMNVFVCVRYFRS